MPVPEPAPVPEEQPQSIKEEKIQQPQKAVEIPAEEIPAEKKESTTKELREAARDVAEAVKEQLAKVKVQLLSDEEITEIEENSRTEKGRNSEKIRVLQYKRTTDENLTPEQKQKLEEELAIRIRVRDE